MAQGNTSKEMQLLLIHVTINKMINLLAQADHPQT